MSTKNEDDFDDFEELEEEELEDFEELEENESEEELEEELEEDSIADEEDNQESDNKKKNLFSNKLIKYSFFAFGGILAIYGVSKVLPPLLGNSNNIVNNSNSPSFVPQQNASDLPANERIDNQKKSSISSDKKITNDAGSLLPVSTNPKINNGNNVEKIPNFDNNSTINNEETKMNIDKSSSVPVLNMGVNNKIQESLSKLEVQVNQKFNKIDENYNKIASILENLDSRVSKIENIEYRLASLETKLNKVDVHFKDDKKNNNIEEKVTKKSSSKVSNNIDDSNKKVFSSNNLRGQNIIPSMQPNIIKNWELKGLSNKVAWLENANGIIQAGIGDYLPEIGRINNIIVTGNNTYVETERGLIFSHSK